MAAMAAPEGALVTVRVQPRASRDEIVAWQGDALRVRVTAPPVAGAANFAVERLVAEALRVAPSTVKVVRGIRSRDKLVHVAGRTLADVRARIAAALTVVLLALAMPAAADHLTLSPEARSSAPRPFDADVNVNFGDRSFELGGRLFGLGAWLRGRLRQDGVTLDGQFKDRHFRLDLNVETYPGTL
jgi:uncharacterized protein (TIGR00251 family)